MKFVEITAGTAYNVSDNVERETKTIFDEKRPQDDPWRFESEVRGHQAMSTSWANSDLSQPPKPWKTFSLETLKGLILFIPGSVLLGLIGVVATMIFTDIVVYRRPYNELPETMFQQLAMLTVVGSLSTVMIWFGIGNLKNRRHFALPLSVFGLGVAIGTIGLIAEAFLGTRGDFIEAFADNNVIVYLLPLLLVVPVLVREWLKPKPENP